MNPERVASLFAVLLCLSLIFVPCTSFASRSVSWYGYEDGRERAARLDKKMLVYFRTTWCGYCRKMENSTFSDREVVAYIKKHFVPVMVDAEKEARLATEYGVSSYPAYWFLGADGEKLRTAKGYLEADIYLKILEYIETGSYEDTDFRDFIKK